MAITGQDLYRYLGPGWKGRLVQLEDTQELSRLADFKQRIAGNIKTLIKPSAEQKVALSDLKKAKEEAKEKIIAAKKKFMSLSPEEKEAKLIGLAKTIKDKVAEKRAMALLEDDMDDEEFYMF